MAMQSPMTVKELSEYLRLDRMTIYKMLKEGSIPASRIGHQWRFFQDDIDEWIRSKRVGHTTRVLVVDPDDATRNLFESSLSLDSWEVTVANNGDDARQYLQEEAYGVVYMELRHRDDILTFQKIQSADSSALILVGTESSTTKLIHEAMDIGPFTLVWKPSSGQALQNMLAGLPLRKNGTAN